MPNLRLTACRAAVCAIVLLASPIAPSTLAQEAVDERVTLGERPVGSATRVDEAESLNGLGPVNRVFIVKYVRQFDLLN